MGGDLAPQGTQPWVGGFKAETGTRRCLGWRERGEVALAFPSISSSLSPRPQAGWKGPSLPAAAASPGPTCSGGQPGSAGSVEQVLRPSGGSGALWPERSTVVCREKGEARGSPADAWDTSGAGCLLCVLGLPPSTAQWFAERRVRPGEAHQMPGTGRGQGVCSPSWVSLQAVWTDFVLCDEMFLKEQGAGAGMPPSPAFHRPGTGGACLLPRPADASLPVQGIAARGWSRFLNF